MGPSTWPMLSKKPAAISNHIHTGSAALRSSERAVPSCYTSAMANIDKHAPGSFCWIELGTTDQNAAKTFYTSLFGWTVQDFPMGPGQSYSMFNLDNRNVGGGYTLQPEMRAAGVPPH